MLWFIDENSKPLEIENEINITLFIIVWHITTTRNSVEL